MISFRKGKLEHKLRKRLGIDVMKRLHITVDDKAQRVFVGVLPAEASPVVSLQLVQNPAGPPGAMIYALPTIGWGIPTAQFTKHTSYNKMAAQLLLLL